jgi:inner membrane protein
MEPATHFLTGACIGRAGFNRSTAYATLAAVLAAEAPDLDVFWSIAGPVASLQHHRGITHTFIAAPVVATVITGFVWLLDKFWLRFWKSRRRSDAPRIRWGWLWFTALIADLSHLLLDWTNNYGLRPFFPFNPHWYEGDLVFIADPIIWGLLVAALLIPTLLGLADREVGARKAKFRGRGWAIIALIGIVLLWCWRWAEHAEGINMVAGAGITDLPIQRIALEPYPTNPWRWHALVETDTTWQVAEVDTRTGLVESDERTDTIYKTYTPAMQIAKGTYLGRVYLDWSQWPVLKDVGPKAAPGNSAPDVPLPRHWTTVEFSDLRFAYPYLHLSMGGAAEENLEDLLAHTGLTGWVYIVDGKEEAGQFLNQREQK